MEISTLRKKLENDRGCKKNLKAGDLLAISIAKDITEIRIKKHLTQEKLAKLIGTKQSSIARLEAGRFTARNSLLLKIAEACGTEFVPPTFACLDRAGYTLTLKTEIPIILSDIEVKNESNYSDATKYIKEVIKTDHLGLSK